MPDATEPMPDLVTEVTHACPPPGTTEMPCCGRTPFEVSVINRITDQAALVTCSNYAHAQAELRELRELVTLWLTGECPMHQPECRVKHLCWHCYENALVDLGLEA